MRTWLRLLIAPVALLTIVVSCGGIPSSPSSERNEPDASVAAAPGTLVAANVAPASLRMAVLGARQTAAGFGFTADAAGVLRSHAGSAGASADVVVSGSGVRVSRASSASSDAFALGVTTTSIARSDGTQASRAVLSQAADGQSLVLAREGAVEERYLAGPLGLEQSYSLQTRPSGQGSLVFQVAFDGLTPELVAGTRDRVRLRDAAGRVQVWYTDLAAVDAGGRALGSRMEVRGDGVALVIDDADASYPVRVDPLVWTQEPELTSSVDGATDGAAGDLFGSSVALNGNLAIIGAPNHAAGAGAAYVFSQSGTTWTLQQELTATTLGATGGAPGDAFGTSVALSGSLAIVGAPNHTVGTKTGAGAAYVFLQSGTTWAFQKELDAGDDGVNDSFGQSVSISGAVALVGAPNHAINQTDGGPPKGEAGAAYVFTQSGTSWGAPQELTASDNSAFDLFGYSVSVSGTTAIIGAYQHDVGALTSAGAAYIFAETSGTWSQTKELTASDGAISDFFGYSVGVSGSTAIVGAYQHGATSAGAAYVYGETDGAWGSPPQELTASDAMANDFFGYSVGVSGGTVVVGALQHTVGAAIQAGAAYVFTGNAGTWTENTPDFTASDDATADLFGSAVAASGDSVLIGAPQHAVSARPQQGAAYAFAGAISADSGCYIDGTLVASGAVNPANSCEECTPATSTTAWSNFANGTTCSDGNACDLTTCQSGTCTVGGHVTCTAPATCYTAGTCNTTTGVCSSATLDSGFCFINNACEATGASDGTNTCETCQPSVSTSAYSPVSNGTTCSNGNACDIATCESGACTVQSQVTCTTPDACHTAGTCSTSTGVCSPPTLKSSFCFIGNACVSTGAANGTNTCETCQPSLSTTTYSPVADGASCSDGNACTLNDTCQAGACTVGSHVTCTAPDACHTAGTCNTTTGVCSTPTLNAGFCYIAGACVASGTTNGANTCEACEPASSTSQFSPVGNGTACNDGVTCTANDVCTNGACGGTAYSCTPTACQVASACNGLGGCIVTNAPNGTACGTGEVCASGSCVSETDDGGTASDAGGTSSDGGSTDHDGGSASDAGSSSGTDGGTGGDGGPSGLDGGTRDSGTTADGGALTDAGSGNGGDASVSSDGGADGATGTTDGGVTGSDSGSSDDGSVGSDDGSVGSDDSGATDDGGEDGATAEDAATSDDGSVGEDGGLLADDGGNFGEDGGAPSGNNGNANGCGCSTVGSKTQETAPSLLLGMAGIGIVIGRRRKRSPKRE
jgi:hypothetical protein